MHRANLVEREIRRPGFPQAKPTKRVVPASRLPNRDPTATSAKRPRRNARRPTAFVANERGQRNAKPARTAADADASRAAGRFRSDDSLVANPTRPRINQLERRLDDATKRRASSVRLRFRSSFQRPFLCSFKTARLAYAPPSFRSLYAKNAALQATERYKPPLRRKKRKKKNRVRTVCPFPTATISVIMRNDGNLRRRIIDKIGKFDKTARFFTAARKEIFAPTLSRAVFFVKISFPRPLFYRNDKKTTRSRKRFPRTISRNFTERTPKWPILRT